MISEIHLSQCVDNCATLYIDISLIIESHSCEEAYEQECETAKTEWVNVTCEKIDTCTDPKEKWQSFRKLTSYRERSNVDVLPLHNEKEEVCSWGKM